MADHPAIKECDIRGPFPGEVNAALFARAGRNLARRIAATSYPPRAVRSIVVGGDGRVSTAELREALVEGLLAGGAAVLDIAGVLPTPALYWAAKHLQDAGTRQQQAMAQLPGLVDQLQRLMAEAGRAA